MAHPVAAPPWRRKLIDAIYGHPKPYRFLGVAGCIGAVWAIALLFVLGVFWTDETSDTAGFVARLPLVQLAGKVGGLVLTVLLCGVLMTYPLGVLLQWRTRTFYRRMFGSYYSEP